MSDIKYFTEEGLKKLRKEIEYLTTIERPKISQQIGEARDKGDLSENAEYDAAKEKQSFIEGKIKDIEQKISGAKVIDITTLSSDRVVFGATVKLEDEDRNDEVEYSIVGVDEADLAKR